MRWVIGLLVVIVLELGVIAMRLPETPARAAGDEPLPVVIVDGSGSGGSQLSPFCRLISYHCATVNGGKLWVQNQP